ncbi:uncharacterized protein EV422DRAFT_538199 [Fimicolochytrium jonesii]|uniref:uncharacterized protein n=1 Tax=Fimicolochytrium jonesii TaxID=1396493 RepID=UPI0022FE149A|nr:uncharacterized protein EV422DRAFT_538199 [Fimicolochytrium jonesii]KAI8818335.1 hypothetical protein EV422DRAFT_538199 [Fimicolochytrium jonesii]
MPWLKALAGNDFDSLNEVAQVNRYPVVINNDLFEGLLIIRINNFDESKLPEPPATLPSETFLDAASYFGTRSRQFSFQVEGRFKNSVNGDDLYWDISFPYPLTGLPFFTPMVVKFLQYLDPATEIDFYAKEQYVRSSVLTMMNAISAWKPLNLDKDDQDAIAEPIVAPPHSPKPLSKTAGPVTSSSSSLKGKAKSVTKLTSKLSMHFKQKSSDSSKSDKSSKGSADLNPTSPKQADSDDENFDTQSVDSLNSIPEPPATVTRNGSTERVLQPDTLRSGVHEDLALIISSLRRASHAAALTPTSPTASTGSLPADAPPTSPTSPTGSATSLNPAEPPRSDVNKRRKFYLSKENRERVTFSPEYVYAFESFNPHMCWTDFTAKIPGFNIDVKKYFPIKRMVRVRMCSKDGKKTYLAMHFELVDEE